MEPELMCFGFTFHVSSPVTDTPHVIHISSSHAKKKEFKSLAQHLEQIHFQALTSSLTYLTLNKNAFQ